MVWQPLRNDVGKADNLQQRLLGADQNIVCVHDYVDGRKSDAIRPEKRKPQEPAGQILDICNSADWCVWHGNSIGLNSRPLAQHDEFLPLGNGPFPAGDYAGLSRASANHIDGIAGYVIALLIYVGANHSARVAA